MEFVVGEVAVVGVDDLQGARAVPYGHIGRPGAVGVVLPPLRVVLDDEPCHFDGGMGVEAGVGDVGRGPASAGLDARHRDRAEGKGDDQGR